MSSALYWSVLRGAFLLERFLGDVFAGAILPERFCGSVFARVFVQERFCRRVVARAFVQEPLHRTSMCGGGSWRISLNWLELAWTGLRFVELLHKTFMCGRGSWTYISHVKTTQSLLHGATGSDNAAGPGVLGRSGRGSACIDCKITKSCKSCQSYV